MIRLTGVRRSDSEKADMDPQRDLTWRSLFRPIRGIFPLSRAERLVENAVGRSRRDEDT